MQKSINSPADGVIGPITLKAVRVRNPQRIVIEFAARRMRRYGLLAIFATFGLGWSRRLMEALYEAFKLAAEPENRKE